MERAKALKVNAGTEADVDLGPVISIQVCMCHIVLILLLPCFELD